MGRPAGSRNRVTQFDSDERKEPKGAPLGGDVLAALKASLDARIALFDSGRVLIDLCYPGRLQILARHHKQLFELDESDIEGLEMQDFPAEILGKGFKTAALIDVLALPGTKKL